MSVLRIRSAERRPAHPLRQFDVIASIIGIAWSKGRALLASALDREYATLIRQFLDRDRNLLLDRHRNLRVIGCPSRFPLSAWRDGSKFDLGTTRPAQNQDVDTDASNVA